MKELIERTASYYNSYSELVALNYERKAQGQCDNDVLQFNSGHLACLYDTLYYLKQSCKGLKFDIEVGEHLFITNDETLTLVYKTIHPIFTEDFKYE